MEKISQGRKTRALTILGAGAMGAALTFPASDAGSTVRLWFTEYDEPIYKQVSHGEPHPRLGVKLPRDVEFYREEDLPAALEGTNGVIVAVSSAGLPSVVTRATDVLGEEPVPVGVITKGFEEHGGMLRTSGELVQSIVGERTVYFAGPSLAGEVALRRPTRVALASLDKGAADALGGLLGTGWYTWTWLPDLRGASLAASLKNPYAILYGSVEGVEEAEGRPLRNLKAALITMVAEEMAGLVEACGGRRETVYTLAGLGDLMVTFMGGRNGMFGRLLGSGMNVQEALGEMEKRGVGVVEGYYNTGEAIRYLSQRCGVNAGDRAPLLSLVSDLVSGRVEGRRVVERLVALWV